MVVERDIKLDLSMGELEAIAEALEWQKVDCQRMVDGQGIFCPIEVYERKIRRNNELLERLYDL